MRNEDQTPLRRDKEVSLVTGRFEGNIARRDNSMVPETHQCGKWL
jgi:hypothetical protein